MCYCMPIAMKTTMYNIIHSQPLTHAWPGVWTADVVYARHVPSHTHTCQSVLTHAWPGVWTADVVYARHVPSHTHTCQSVLTHAWPGVWTADVVYARHVSSHTHVSVCTHPCLARCLDSGCSVRPPCPLSHTRVCLYSPMPGPVSGQRM